MMTEHILLDFTHIYFNEVVPEKGFSYVDVSDICGTDMFCTKEAATEIRKRLEPFGPRGIHFLDNGNYHYATLFFTEKIHEPFSLILFDHHTDMQKPMLSGLLSCGNWAGELISKNHYLKQLILIGPEQKNMDAIEERFRSKLICFEMEEQDSEKMEQKIQQIDFTLPIYISIDKDILSCKDARTNWNQGDMPLYILKKLLLDVFLHQRVIGVDICGECSLQEPFPQFLEDAKINKKTDDALYEYLLRLFQFQKKEIEKKIK